MSYILKVYLPEVLPCRLPFAKLCLNVEDNVGKQEQEDDDVNGSSGARRETSFARRLVSGISS